MYWCHNSSIKKTIQSTSNINITRIRTRNGVFEKKFKEMIFQEETIANQSIFSENDWLVIANERDAFGYATSKAPRKKGYPYLRVYLHK